MCFLSTATLRPAGRDGQATALAAAGSELREVPEPDPNLFPLEFHPRESCAFSQDTLNLLAERARGSIPSVLSKYQEMRNTFQFLIFSIYSKMSPSDSGVLLHNIPQVFALLASTLALSNGFQVGEVLISLLPLSRSAFV